MSLSKIIMAGRAGRTAEQIGMPWKIRRAAASTSAPAEMSGVLKIALAAGLPRPDGLSKAAVALARQLGALHRLVDGAPRRAADRQARLKARRDLEATAAAGRQAALRPPPQPPWRHPDPALAYLGCRERLAAEIKARSVSCSAEALAARIGELAGLSPDLAAEWAERFLADAQRHVERRRPT